MLAYISTAPKGKMIGWNVIGTKSGKGEFPVMEGGNPKSWRGWFEVEIANPAILSELVKLYAKAAGLSFHGIGRWRFLEGVGVLHEQDFHRLVGLSIGDRSLLRFSPGLVESLNEAAIGFRLSPAVRKMLIDAEKELARPASKASMKSRARPTSTEIAATISLS
jgi:hypothetical protein